MKRKLFSLTLALALTLTLITPAFSAPPLPIVEPPPHYAYIVGYEDGTIRPQASITRAEVATIFFRMLRDEIRALHWTTNNAYSDVPSEQWYNNAVSVLSKMQILSGLSNGEFRPDAPITRAEMAAVTTEFMRLDGAAPPAGNTITFSDVGSHWAKESIDIAASAGWMQGYADGTFQPNAPITRAETMAMMNRLLHRAPETPADLLSGMLMWPDNMDLTAWYFLDVQEATNSHEIKVSTGSIQVPGQEFYYEKWGMLLSNRDWVALELLWLLTGGSFSMPDPADTEAIAPTTAPPPAGKVWIS